MDPVSKTHNIRKFFKVSNTLYWRCADKPQ